MAKEKTNPTTDFVTEMVERLEGRSSKGIINSGSRARPAARPVPKKRQNIAPTSDAAIGSPTTMALRDLMNDLGASPLANSPQLPVEPENLIPRGAPLISSLIDPPRIPSLLVTEQQNSTFPANETVSEAEPSTMHDELINENGCMADTTDYDTDYLVTDNLTDYQVLKISLNN